MSSPVVVTAPSWPASHQCYEHAGRHPTTPQRWAGISSAHARAARWGSRGLGHLYMTAPHSSYEELAAQRRDSGQYREGYAEARRAFLIGQAVRERRLALGLSQAGLAARADRTQLPSHAWRLEGRTDDPAAERISSWPISRHSLTGIHSVPARLARARRWPTSAVIWPALHGQAHRLNGLSGIRRHDGHDGVKGPLSSRNAGAQGLTPLFGDHGVRAERTLTAFQAGSQVQASPSSFA